MQIVRKEREHLNVKVELRREPAEYAPKCESEKKKDKKQAQIKGLGKGMTRVAKIKKI